MRELLRYVYFLIAVCIFPAHVYAATLYFDPVHTVTGINGYGEVSVLLNPELEHVNAIEATVVYPRDSIEITGISTKNSIVPFWVEEPNIREGRIRFSGIVPNGFSGLREAYATERKSGIVLTIEYRGVLEGAGAFSIEDARVFLNDGKATEAALSIVPGSIVVQALEGVTQDPVVPDTVPPERFSAYLVNNSLIEKSQWVVVFSTTDKESGVEYYEVAEVKGGAGGEVKWNRAVSPYVLHDQTRSKEILVRAVDRTGNVREADTIIDPLSSRDVSLFGGSDTGILTIVLLVLVIAVSFIVYVRKRQRE